MDIVNGPFPEEIVGEILVRAEFKTAARCKTLNKFFCNLISSDAFKVEHLKLSKELDRQEHMFCAEFGFSPLFYDARSVWGELNGRVVSEDDKIIEFVASCDGLVLGASLDDDFYLTNPITGKVHRLPTLKIEFPEGSLWASVFFGIGYTGEDEYKVIRVAMFNTPEFKTEVRVYSVKEGFWGVAPDFPHDFPIGRPGVWVKGRLHWKVCESHNRYSITTLRLSDLSYGRMAMPDTPVIFGNLELCRLDEDTLGVYSSMVPVGTPYKLWILHEYDDTRSWAKLEIHLGPILTQGNHFCSLQPLHYVKPGRGKILFRVDPVGTFWEFNIRTSVFVPKNFADVRDCFCTTYGFIPSFLSPSPPMQ